MRNKLQGAQKRIDSDENKSHLRKAGKPPRKWNWPKGKKK